MIKFITNTSSGTNIVGKVVLAVPTVILLGSAAYWEFNVPQQLYELHHPQLSPKPEVHIQYPHNPPEPMSFTSSGHAILLDRLVNG